jgi:acetoin utilization deacetylase AcuC-like enzyme
MKVIFHDRFYEVYSHDPAAAPGRMEAIVRTLKGTFEFMEPGPASERDLERLHGREHIRSVKQDPALYEVALLAAGGAILAAERASEGQLAVAIKKLLSTRKIRNALILDFDLHYGDGTASTFEGSHEVCYFHPVGTSREACLKDIQRCLEAQTTYDIIGLSAGFDRHEEDWGGLLKTEDYYSIGKWAKEYSLEHCRGRRFGVLEGGYNHTVLGQNVKRFLQGLTD